MKRLANIILVADMQCEKTRALETSLRRVARVLTVGKPFESHKVDQETKDRPDIVEFVNKLPSDLQPDVVIWSQPVNHLIPLNMDHLSCFTLAITHSVWEGLSEYLSYYKLGIATELETGRSLNIPYVSLFQEDSITPPPYDLMEEMMRFTLGEELVKHPEHYLEILETCSNKTSSPEVTREELSDRSIIIPVLDESPASTYNISTLLDDLVKIEGEVICVFNHPAMAEKYECHPRVDKSASLSENVGVGRAWNIGTQMSTAKLVFFLNSDLKLGPEGIDTLSEKLIRYPVLGVVGPCGGYIDFSQAQDLYYYSSEGPAVEALVDQVSFHYFGMRREVFYKCDITFHSEYIPCFMEEWDMALKLREYGMSALRVPLNDYDHKMGGSANKSRELSCLGQVYDMEKTLEQNKSKFLARWEGRMPTQNEIFVTDILQN